MQARYALFLSLINEHSLSIPEAGKLLGFTRGSSYQLAAKLKKEANDGKLISRTMPESLLRKADRRASQLLDGKTFGKVSEVKCSTVAKIVEKVWERGYPTKQQQEASSGEFHFTQININQFRNPDGWRYGDPRPTADATLIDATPAEEHKPLDIKALME
jgi:hypothetical protein